MKAYKKPKKQEVQDIFIKTNHARDGFSITWLMDILNIYLEEQLLIKFYLIKYLALLKSSYKQTVLGQFFTCDFPIYKKDTRKL